MYSIPKENKKEMMRCKFCKVILGSDGKDIFGHYGGSCMKKDKELKGD